MLLRNMQSLYNADNTEGTTTTTQTDTQQQQNGNEEKPKLFTQEELSKVAAKEARDAKAKAEKAMLEALGVSNLDEIKSLLTAQREKQEAEKTEAQKLLDALNLAKQENAAFQQKLLEAEKSRRAEKRDSELKALLSKAHEPKQVLILLKALHGDKLDGLLDDAGDFDAEEAQKLVSDYQKANPFMFKDSSPGSAMSNKDGMAPQANEEAKKALTRMTAKSLKGF